MGALFDASCEFWQEQCGDRGNCWVYNNEDLTLRIFVFSTSVRILSSIFAICVWIFFDVTLCSHYKAEETSKTNNDDIPMVELYIEAEQ